MNMNRIIILIGALTLLIVTLGCIGSTQEKTAVSSIPGPTETVSKIDVSSLSLPDNFKSLSDGLKLIPPGISWAYFTNLKQATGLEESTLPETDFYGTQIIGMLNSEYSENSWIELHDLGRSVSGVQSKAGADVDNILYTRPFIYSTKDRTGSVMALMKEQGNATAYNTYESILEEVDDESAGYAKIELEAPSFANASYIGLISSGNDVIGEIAFSIKDKAVVPRQTYDNLKNSSSGRGFRSYDITMQNNTLIIRMTSNLDNVVSEVSRNYGITI
ncbi:MAG: hypothetical protein OIN87_00985 [Candidatus Methanoperedens sp.]|nr:hypothetical protein [Candidatus Methanoperedens sp.]